MPRSATKNSTHRPERAANTQENRNLKQENKQLKKQLARAQKELAKLDGQVDLAQDVELDRDGGVADEIDTKKPMCPVCRSTDLLVINLPGKIVRRCNTCREKELSK